VASGWTHRLTNEKFQQFVSATSYITTSERPPDPSIYPEAHPSLLVPGSLVFRKPRGPVELRDFRAWWELVPAADWRHPEGPDSTIDDRDDPSGGSRHLRRCCRPEAHQFTVRVPRLSMLNRRRLLTASAAASLPNFAVAQELPLIVLPGDVPAPDFALPDLIVLFTISPTIAAGRYSSIFGRYGARRAGENCRHCPI
jgi:hypothetical protein